MLFAVIFTDKPDHAAVRAEYLQAHIDWVAKHQETVLVAGSLREKLAEGAGSAASVSLELSLCST